MSTYLAFISHSSKDKRIASLLDHALERYRFPKELRRSRPDIPAGRGIFSYMDDLSGINLSQEIVNSLKNSEYLVVLCSPDARASRWVDREISLYCQCCAQKGVEPRIIPVVVSGNHHEGQEDAPDECYPRELSRFEKEHLRGEDHLRRLHIRDGLAYVTLNLLSTMYGVEFRRMFSVWKRHMLEKVALLAVLLVGLTWGIWKFFEVTSWEYYKNYEYTSTGDVRGIDRIYWFQTLSRCSSYRIETNKGSTVLTRINAFGRPTEEDNYDAGRPTRMVIGPWDDKEERIERIIMDLSASGILKTRYRQYVLSDHAYCIMEDDFRDFPAKKYHTGLGSLLPENIRSDQQWDMPMNLVYREFAPFGNRDRTSLVSYHYVQGSASEMKDSAARRQAATVNELGVHAQAFRYVSRKNSEQDSLIVVTFLDMDGKVVNCKYGYAGVESQYNEEGFLRCQRFLDKNGDTASDVYGRSYIYVDYDDYGNRIRVSFNDKDNQPVNGPSAYASKTLEYRFASWVPPFKHAVLYKVSMFDRDGRPTYCANNSEEEGYSQVRMDKYDRRGNVLRKSFYDINGKLFSNKVDSCAYVVISYNPDGNVRSKEFYDEENRPRILNGFFKWEAQYDRLGRRKRVEYLDARGNLSRRRDSGFAAYEVEYGRHGQITGTRYFDETGRQLTNSDRWGCARWEMNYHETPGRTERERLMMGEVESLVCYGPDDKPIKNIEGCAQWKVNTCDVKDSLGYVLPGYRVREFTFYDERGNVADNKENYSRAEYLYDYLGRKLLCSFHSRGNRQDPVFNYTSYRATYDTSNDLRKKEFYSRDLMAELSLEKDTWQYAPHSLNGRIDAFPYAEGSKTYMLDERIDWLLVPCSYWEADYDRHQLVRKVFFKAEKKSGAPSRVGTLYKDVTAENRYCFLADVKMDGKTVQIPLFEIELSGGVRVYKLPEDSTLARGFVRDGYRDGFARKWPPRKNK